MFIRAVDVTTGIRVPIGFVEHQYDTADEKILSDLSLGIGATSGFHFEGRSLPRNY